MKNIFYEVAKAAISAEQQSKLVDATILFLIAARVALDGHNAIKLDKIRESQKAREKREAKELAEADAQRSLKNSRASDKETVTVDADSNQRVESAG